MKRDIPLDQWASFLKSFTLQHDRWLVSIDSDTEHIIDQPLEGLIAAVVITVAHTRVTVDEPQKIEVESENGVDRGLSIEDRAGRITRVTLRVPIAPELVDGMI
jgi:hypothetical protein